MRIKGKGVKLEVRQGPSNYKIKKLPPPDKVSIPFAQHIGEPASPLVQKGDYVKQGEKIAKSEAFISSFIHSSISGKVEKIKDVLHPKIGRVKGAIIKNDGLQEKDDSILGDKREVGNIDPSGIVSSIRAAGIVGMGGASFPTHVKLSPPENKEIDDYILNGAECEPLLEADSSLMIQNAKSVILGMKLAMKAIGVKKGYVGIEKDNVKAINMMRQAIEQTRNEIWKSDIELCILPTSYPQGSEKQIIKTVLGKEVPPEGLPYEVGAIVNNISTCFSIYEAVAYKKPLYERVITVTENYGEESFNILVPIGTTIRDVINYCGIDTGIGKVALGGPMMGETQYDLDTPVVKGTTGIVLFGKTSKEKRIELKCIKCGKCVNVCPVNLIPTRLAQLVDKEMWKELKEYNLKDCIECGCCSYICPSNIPLVHLIKLGKSKNKY